MLVNNGHKCIFIHIPKTGGEFIRNNIADNLGIEKHIYFELGKMFISETQRQYTSFCVVRNPYDWMVSFYHHLRKSRELFWEPIVKNRKVFLNPVRAARIANFHSFEVFLDKVIIQQQLQIEELVSPFIYNFAPQINWLPKNLERHQTFYFEERGSLNRFVENIARINLEKSNADRNSSKRMGLNYRKYYKSKCLRREFEEIYRQDLERFSYDF
jgi:hypothetical protein